MKRDTIELLLMMIGTAVLLVAVGLLNNYNNAKHEEQCRTSGGTYFKATNSSRSLCKLGDHNEE